MVLLIGNYAPDQQQSMQRFNTMMLQGLTAAGIQAELLQPEPFFGNLTAGDGGVAKWLGYVDKYLLFPFRLGRKGRGRASLIHILDHSNAMYASRARGCPVVVTCHDLLAVRGALGEQTDCPASWTGRILQRWILRGLRQADQIACVSRATARDAERLLGNGAKIRVVDLGLNYPYRRLDPETARLGLAGIRGLRADAPFVLHVGSNLRRKNREGVLRIFARDKEKWDGQLVFAGDRLSPPLLRLADELGIAQRVVQIENPDNKTLEILYNSALALLYPSRFEGFGWPVIEAQACGCPVLSSNSGPLPEVAGEAALMRDVEDEEGFAADLLRLTDPAERKLWSDKSLRNAERFSTERMIHQYIEIYRQLGATS